MPAVVSLESDVESTVSVGTNGTIKPRIPRQVLKQLFYDIEHAGGIQTFDKGLHQGLNILLDKGDPKIYGLRGDYIRKTLSNKVCKWKALPIEKYHHRLFKLQLQPAQILPKSNILRLEPKKQKKRTVSGRTLEDSVPCEIAYEADLLPLHWTDTHIVQEQQKKSAAQRSKLPRTGPPSETDYLYVQKKTTNYIAPELSSTTTKEEAKMKGACFQAP